MAQAEHTRMYFMRDSAAQIYLDCAAALTAVNHKQYHQVAGDGTPLCYSLHITPANRGITTEVHTAPNNWCTRGGVKMASAAWKAQLKNAGLSARDLPRYGKRLRVTLEAESLDHTFSESGRTVRAMSSNLCLQPLNTLGDAVFTEYVDTGGDDVDYYNGNPITSVAITNQTTGVTTEEPMNLLASQTNQFPILAEYHETRRNVESLETDNVPDSASKMMVLFSGAQETSEDIIEAMDDTGDNRPYDDTSQLMNWGTFSDTRAIVDNTDPGATTASCWPPCGITVEAPLGLLKLPGLAESSAFFVDVLAIYEM